MFSRLQEIEEKFLSLEAELGNPDTLQDTRRFQHVAKEHAELQPIVNAYREYKEISSQIEDARLLCNDADADIKEMAEAEVRELEQRKRDVEQRLKLLLLPKDARDDKNTILEIRAGTGGEEAALFVADLFRMYSRYAERKHWKLEILSESPTGMGGYKEIIVLISGNNVYSRLKYESGTHRVQRVPETEAQGRIHTSAVTVAVLPEADDVDIQIDPSELRIDVFRASGAGGQHVNKTESAVRITHLPTGLVVQCQDERSQHKNRAKAMKVLAARLLDMKAAEQQANITEERRSMVGTGDRSGRIRTYNFPQGRVTDHRIGLTLYRLDSIMDGDIDEIIDALAIHQQALLLAGNSTD